MIRTGCRRGGADVASTRERLLPDRTAKVEALLYLLGPGLTAVGLVLVLVFSPSSGPGSTPTANLAARAVTVVVGLTLAALALARRVRPDRLTALVLAGGALGAASAVVTGAIDPPSVSGSFLASMVLFAVAVRRCPPRVAVLSGLLAAVTYGVSAVASSGSFVDALEVLGGGPAPRSTLSAATGWLVALLVGLLLRSGDGSRRVEALARVRASERLLVARELHDLVARHVTGMVVRTQALGVVAPDLPASARSALDDIETAGNDALAAMRRMVGVLREVDGNGLAGLDDLPTAAVDVGSAIRGAIDEDGVQGLALRVDVDPALDAGPAPQRELLTTVHRLVAESLTNVARHAPAATDVDVTAAREDDDLVVAVANDGVAAGPRGAPGRGGFGLVGMSERVRALGGTLRSGPDGTGRWVVEARIPVRDEAVVAPGT